MAVGVSRRGAVKLACLLLTRLIPTLSAVQGRGVVRTMGRSGMEEEAITVNSTVIAPPLTVWQVENTGKEDLQVLVVIGCRRPGITFFPSWNSTKADTAAHRVMPWNAQCPPAMGPGTLKQLI